MNRSKIVEFRDKSMKDFLNNLGILVKMIHEKNKRHELMAEIYDKYSIIRKDSPTAVIETVGPYIWKYRAQIVEKNVSFFLANDFTEDIIENKQKKEIAEITSFEDIPIILDIIKRTWHCFISAEQQNIIKLIRSLLQSYAGYVSAGKRLIELESSEQEQLNTRLNELSI